ncbi:hypothetical protein DID96_12475 [Burkholderia sp. Bp8963]|uniref:arginase family protein n=1 Tax=Burkholderia sp. Bp8963 TaxID=2184547 RepID=UPI000F5B8516|nr:arginase family protein [Burkholderia sp. Bp8963]RQS71544.1 hypothetical protein DID96_12475 [Burkholderia sp. Bp8963]
MHRELSQPMGGIATMMRLPQATTTDGLDVCFVGVPLDLGTSNRSGSRFGPRQIRSESVLLRPYNMSFDIDGLDPSFAPGTGTPEVGGLTVQQDLEIVRGMKGLNIVGADIVEVSPPYDPFGTTALVGANLAFEMLCVMPGVACR